jgi:hypothetical protein
MENSKYLIDCDVLPFIPEGYKVKRHKKGGMIDFDPAEFELYLSERQERGISGWALKRELEQQSIFNANLLDSMLKSPEIIPKKCKGKYTYFWGTTYVSSVSNHIFVRYLFWNNQKSDWDCGLHMIDRIFYYGRPAAVRS